MFDQFQSVTGAKCRVDSTAVQPDRQNNNNTVCRSVSAVSGWTSGQLITPGECRIQINSFNLQTCFIFSLAYLLGHWTPWETYLNLERS